MIEDDAILSLILLVTYEKIMETTQSTFKCLSIIIILIEILLTCL